MPPLPVLSLSELKDKYFIPAFGGPIHAGDVVVIPHVDGEAYFGAIADALDNCQGPGDKIYIASWLFGPAFSLRTRSGTSGPGSGVPLLGSILVDKANSGADVRIVVAAPFFSSGREGLNPTQREWWEKKIRGVGEEVIANNIREVRALRSAKRGSTFPLDGRVLLDWGGSTSDARHEKTTIIYSDSTKELRAFLGGIDFSSTRISNLLHNTLRVDGSDTWHDVGVELYGSAAESALDNFITRWTETATLPPLARCMLDGVVQPFNPPGMLATPPSRPTSPVHPVPISSPAGESSVCILRSFEEVRAVLTVTGEKLPWATLPAIKITEILDVLKQAIVSSKRYIYVEDQTLNPSRLESIYVTHDDLYPAISAACAKGVKVIFLCYYGLKTVSPTMSPEIEQKILDPLPPAQRQNFALYWISGARLHSKLVIIDDEFAAIGSANLWDRSMQGTESELNASFVYTGGENSKIADLRVRLWCEHLRVSPTATAVAEAELRDLDKGLGIFRPAWATSSLSFAYPNSALKEITP